MTEVTTETSITENAAAAAEQANRAAESAIANAAIVAAASEHAAADKVADIAGDTQKTISEFDQRLNTWREEQTTLHSQTAATLEAKADKAEVTAMREAFQKALEALTPKPPLEEPLADPANLKKEGAEGQPGAPTNQPAKRKIRLI